MEGFTPAPAVNADGTPAERDYQLEAGSLFTELLPGEDIALVDPKRPNTILEQFRTAMMRAVSRAIGLSYSSLSGDYDGTYSAQRQELVEAYDGYRAMTQTFAARFVQPVWERFVTLAIASGQLKVPAHIRPETVAQAAFRGPKMPWIDPKKEAEGLQALFDAKVESRTAAIADRGGRIQDKFEEIAREQALASELGIDLSTKPAATPSAPDPAADTNPDARTRGPRLRAVGTSGDIQ